MMYWLLLAFATISSTIALKAEDYFTICHTKDPNFEKCLEKTIENLRPLLKKGSKELRIPAVEPMVVPRVKVEQGSGPVSIDSTFINLKVSGITNFKLSKASADLKKGILEFGVDIPYLYMEGDYEMRGRILVLPITGNGDSYSNYTGVSGVMSLKLKPVVRDGVKYLNLEKLNFDIKVKRAEIHMDNLFNGNKELGDAMNNFITQNWEVVFQELKPVIDTAISSILESIASKIFAKFPASEILPD